MYITQCSDILSNLSALNIKQWDNTHTYDTYVHSRINRVHSNHFRKRVRAQCRNFSKAKQLSRATIVVVAWDLHQHSLILHSSILAVPVI